MSGDRVHGRTRNFGADQFQFVVESSDPELCALIDDLFQDLPVSHDPSREPHKFTLDRGRGGWLLGGVGLRDQVTETLSGALARLLAAVNVGALDASPDHLHLHAAAAARDERSVVIAAARGTGKTTTVAHLVHNGWSFLTDETVVLSVEDDCVRCIPRPLSVKPGGRSLVPFLESHMLPGPSDSVDPCFVPVGATGAPVRAEAAPHLVVLLRRSPNGSLAKPLRLHPADAVVRLMGQTLDAGRFGPPAVVRLATLAAASHCVDLLAGSPESTAQTIQDLVDEPSTRSVSVEARPMHRGVIATVLLGNRAVVHNTATGTIVALDPQGTQVWEHLAGWRDHDHVDLREAPAATFVERLRDLGLV